MACLMLAQRGERLDVYSSLEHNVHRSLRLTLTTENIMEQDALEGIRRAVRAAHDVVRTAKLDSCDVDDIDEVISALEQELARPHPNKNTLGTYLNSLVRSLRSEPSVSDACAQLNDAMRDAGIPQM